MKNIQNSAALLFIAAVVILSVVSVLGIWDFFSKDVIAKSFQTLGLLSIVAMVVIVAGRFVGGPADPTVITVPDPIFTTIRRVTVNVLIVASVLLAFLGVCAIWEVISDREIVYKSLSSLGILAFSAFIIVMTSLEREDSPILKRAGKSSAKGVLGTILIVYLIFVLLGALT